MNLSDNLQFNEYKVIDFIKISIAFFTSIKYNKYEKYNK